MLLIKKTALLLLILLTAVPSACLAQEATLPKESPVKKFSPFLGQVNANNINIRIDSTTSSEIVCTVNKGEYLEVESEFYDWYKISLPLGAPSFIKKDFVMVLDNKSAKVIKDGVNIRLHPATSSAIIGKANKNEVIFLLEDRIDWYKIFPVNNSFGWISKNFVGKATKPRELQIKQGEGERVYYKEPEKNKNMITVEGLIKPKVIKQIATHKLIGKDKKVYLLKSEKVNLTSFSHRKVRITGKLVDTTQQENPLIEVEKIEAVD